MTNATPVNVDQKSSIYNKAFDLLSLDILEDRIIPKEILTLSYLLKKFIELVRDVGGDTIPYKAARLRKRKESRYPQVVFHAPIEMTKGTLVYPDDIEVGEIADKMEVDDDDIYIFIYLHY